MKAISRLVVIAFAVLVSFPGMTQAQSTGSAGFSGSPSQAPLAATTCYITVSTTPSTSVDVNQTLTVTASFSTPCTVGTGNYAYNFALPANCTAPKGSTPPITVTSPTVTFSCRPRYPGNVTIAQQATYYDYDYNITVRGFACIKSGCAAPGDPDFVVQNYTPLTVFGEPRLLPGGTGASALSAEVGVSKSLNTSFPLGVVGVDQTLSKNWILKNAPVGGAPDQIAYDTSTNQLFITNSATGYNVSAYSINEGIVTANIATGNDPNGVVAVGGKIYVSNSVSGNISVINPQTDAVVGSISSVNWPTGMVYDPVNGYLYVAASTNITVVNVTTESIAGYIPMPKLFYPRYLGYDPSTHEVYATDNYISSVGTAAHNISAIYTAPGTIGTLVAVINVGSYPSAIGYSSVSHDIYVANAVSNSVTIISDSTNTVVKTIGVGTNPTGITTWLKDEGHLFMSNANSANVTVLNTTTNTVQFNFRNSGLDNAMSILDYGDLVLTNFMTGNLITILFQNSTIPEYGSGLEAPAGSTQGQILWVSNNSKVVSVSACSFSVPNQFCSIDPTAPGYAMVVVQPSDTNGGDSYFGATNVTFRVHVYPRIQAGPLVSNVSSQGQLVADAGSPVTLKVSVWNGTGPGTYTSNWSGLPSGCVSSNATWISCVPTFKTVGIYTVSVSVRDPLGGTLTRTNTLTVYPNPKVSILSASNRSAYTNVSLFVNPTVTGGAPPYSFCVSAAKSTSCAPVTQTNSTDLSYTIPQPGTYTVNVSVQDAAGVVRTYTFNEQVAYHPRLVNVVGPSQADAGQKLIFTAQLPSGYGIAPLNITWTNSNTGQLLCPTQTYPRSNVTSTCSFLPGSSVNIAVTVTDSAGSSWISYSPLIVHPDPAVALGSLSGLPGKPIAVDVRLSEGVSPYTVCLTYPTTSCVKVTNGVAFFNVTYAKPGNYILNVSVNDSLGENVSAAGIVSVYSPMKLGSISVNHNTVDAGVTDEFNASVLGGSPNFNTWWNESGSGTLCAGPNLPTCSSSLSGNGVVTVSLTVADSFGEVAFQSTSVTVNSHLSVLLPTETLTAGRQGWLNGTVSGGTAPYSWTLTGVPGLVGRGSSGTLSIQATVASPGNYSLYFQVSDQGGGKITMVWQVSVVPPPSSQLVAPCAPQGPKSLHPMENGTYNLTCASGGTSPYKYAWIWADSSVTQGNSSATHYFEAAGFYNITVMVRDTIGNIAFSRALEVVVTGQVIQGPPSLPCAPTGPSNLSVGAKGVYSISCATGGTVPYTYTWEIQDGTTTVGGSSISHLFDKTGTFEVTVEVTDSLGRVATSMPLSVTVKAVHTTSGTSVWSEIATASTLLPWLLIGFAVAAIAYLTVRKYRPKSESQEDGANTTPKESTPVDDQGIEGKED